MKKIIDNQQTTRGGGVESLEKKNNKKQIKSIRFKITTTVVILIANTISSFCASLNPINLKCSPELSGGVVV